MVASNNTLRSAPSKNTNIPRASMNCGAALEKRVERFASRRMLLCPRYIATINIASADTIFKLNTTRYGKPSVVCVRRSNTMNAPLSRSTLAQCRQDDNEVEDAAAYPGGCGQDVRKAHDQTKL